MTAGGTVSRRDVTVAITRPLPQAQILADKLRRFDMRPIVCPLTEIVPFEHDAKLQRQFDDFIALQQHAAAIIFVSVHAVAAARPYLQNIALSPSFKIAAVGAATADALRRCGLSVHCVPSPPYNSERLLALPFFDAQHLRGKAVLIVRGDGGREYLATELKDLGADVDYAEVYRRVYPAVDIAALLAQHPDVIVVTSNGALRHLHHCARDDNRARLLSRRLLVVSTRAAQLATHLGFAPPSVAMGADDESLIAALMRGAQGS